MHRDTGPRRLPPVKTRRVKRACGKEKMLTNPPGHESVRRTIGPIASRRISARRQARRMHRDPGAP
jgi:hypothetical protein